MAVQPQVFLGVLFGAGEALRSRKVAALKELTRTIFSTAEQLVLSKLPQQSNSEFLVDLVTQLTAIVESSEHTNAGRGSELTLAGTVECDASIMLYTNHRKAYASVGAVPNIENPIQICSQMLNLQLNSVNQARSVPNFIVGEGASSYAERVLGISRSTDLITERAQKAYSKWTSQPSLACESHPYTDTIGLVAVFDGNICVSSSSGGALLKDPGRLGPAAIFGSGFDINNNQAVVCSGFGEDINTLRLASRIVMGASPDDTDLEALLAEAGDTVFTQRTSQYGVLKASIRANDVLFEWQHSADSMVCAVGEIAEKNTPKFIYSNKPSGGGIKYKTL